MSQAGTGMPGNQQLTDAAAVTPPGVVNVANALTVLRLVLVPAFVALLLTNSTAGRIAAFAVFGVASATDLLDGEVARRRGLITDFGKIADPIADKALTGSALVTLSLLAELSWWVTGVILLREIAVTALRFWVIRRGVIAASRGGKIKTLLQIIAISLYVLPWHLGAVRVVAMAAAVAVTVVTGGDYVARAVRLHRAVPHKQGAAAAADERPSAAPPAAVRPAAAAAADDQAARAAAAAVAAAAAAAAAAALGQPADQGGQAPASER